jgi:UDP-GlcNAc:undecaprenyl-phosphate GlcNAc-1-phosphate transferase
VIKGQLKKLKGRHTVVRTAFPLIQFLCPAVLGMSCLYLSVVPGYFGLICLIMAGCLIAAVAAQTRWLGGILRFSLYLVIPLLIFQCEGCIVGDLPKVTRRLFDLSFGMMVFMVIMTLKFTRRRKGFRVTTLDFIVLFLALVVPNLPDPRIQSFHMGIVTTRIIALLFSYEVMIGELRGELKGQSLMAAGFLLLVAVKAFLGDFSAGGIETTGMGAIMPP